MSIKIMSAVYDGDLTDIYETSVMLALANHADDEGRCYPSIKRIAKLSRVTERGVQKVIKRLVERGYLDIQAGAGRGGTNVYFVIPEPRPLLDMMGRGTPNPVHPEPSSPPEPRDTKPRTPFTPPLNPATLNPEPRSPEPSVTTNEPSGTVTKSARGVDDSVHQILCDVGGVCPEAVTSFISYRKKHRSKSLTVTGAKRLAKHLWEIFSAGSDPNDALGMAEESGWATVEPSWYFNRKGNRNDNRNQNIARAGNPRASGPHNSMLEGFARSAYSRSS